MLIQEMNLKVDQGFLSALLELFAANEPLPREEEVSRPWIFARSYADHIAACCHASCCAASEEGSLAEWLRLWSEG